MKRLSVGILVALALAGCDSGIVATDGTNLLNEAMGDVVERSDSGAITVDGNSYLTTSVEHTFTDDDRSSQYYGERRTIFYQEVNVNGTTIRCFATNDCAALIREEITRQQNRRIPVDDGDQM